jgi:hypothetical protein
MSTISELVEDWGGFEEFGGVLFKNSSDVTVERNVKLYGRSVTPRVIDILIRQRIPPTSEIRTHHRMQVPEQERRAGGSRRAADRPERDPVP